MNSTLLQLFHDGANSLLYYKEDPALGRQQVVKVLKDGTGYASRVASFYNEFEIAKDLQIEGVPRYYGKEVIDGKPAIIMEYIDGKSLSVLFKGKPCSLPAFFTIATKTAEILAAIHREQIIHKDINPNNILFQEGSQTVSIIDFGISSKVDMRKQQLGNPDILEGTLAYISPEQTGRMNRVIDFRTDLYSLGITFYELLVGRLPFSSRDSMELVHCHLARRPLPPCEVESGIPEALSDIVMKLLEKNASDRYQSAEGLLADLQHCQQEYADKKKVKPFPLGQHDYSDKLQLSQRLYGCDAQQAMLMEAFDRVSNGSVEIVLVKGYAGVGKSSLVSEVHRPITEKRGYFIKGKHDQYQRNRPYAALIQAFNDLVEQILTESPEQIERWKNRILQAVGQNGAVLIEVIPNMRLIIGPQPEAEKLSAAEAANRFTYLFRSFIEAISQKEHPLVIFLDDLQWADIATINSLKLLLTDKSNSHLLVIGSFRSNEVNETHPLTFMVDDLIKGEAKLGLIEMDNLAIEHVEAFVADSLRCKPEQSRALSKLVYEKTQGNAFFVNQFMQSLYDEGLLFIDRSQKNGWQWDLERIQQKNITNNVVELMAAKLGKLPESTKEALKLASCIGDKFDLMSLAAIYERPLMATFNDIWPAVKEGLIHPLDDNYKIIPVLEEAGNIAVKTEFQFLHDRVQQAAYQLIPDVAQKRLHFKIGQLLLKSMAPEELDVRLFEVVNQLNAGIDFIGHEQERIQLAQMNFKAGIRAKDANAYEAAYGNLRIALDLYGDKSWEKYYEEVLPVYVETAETSYLLGKRDEMDSYIKTIIAHAQDPLDQVKAYEVKINAHTANAEMSEAVAVALSVLKLLGVTFPKRPNKLHVLGYLMRLELAIRGKSEEDIIRMPKMTDARARASVRIMSSIALAAYFSNRQLYPLLSIKQALVALKYGIAYTTPSAFASLALVYSAVLQRYEKGHFLGSLAIKLMEARQSKKLQARVSMIMYAIVQPWRAHAAKGIEHLKDGFQRGMEMGDFEYGLHCALEHILCGIYSGQHLHGLFDSATRYFATAREIGQTDPKEVLQTMSQALEIMTSAERVTSSLTGTFLDEENDLPQFVAHKSNTSLACAYILKVYMNMLYQEPMSVWGKNLRLAYEYADSVRGTVGAPIINFSHSMLLLYDMEKADKKQRAIWQKTIRKNQQRAKVWMENAPMNISHRYWLIEAELASLDGQLGKAGKHFKTAIRLAQENDYLNDEAVILERFANFCMKQENKPVAGLYLRKAYLAFQRWGAEAKLLQMRKKYYELLLPEETPDLTSRKIEKIDTSGLLSSVHTSVHTTRRFKTTTSNSSSVHLLDFSTLLKASQALSQEVNMDSLLQKMLQITMENAGAQKGIFVQKNEDGAMAIASGVVPADGYVPVGMPVSQSNLLPVSMVNYVARTLKPMVLGDAAKDDTYAFDTYIKEQQPKSVMCFPVLNQGNLNGIIYLENNLATNAFTEERLEVLNMLSAQMAISLENAALYNNLERKVAERTAALHESNEALQEKNKKITDSIRYAQTIQNAVLPTHSQLRSVFGQYFLIHKPKDIVSGDFYWVNYNDKAVFVAVADCTGHGVPGAFMSMIGESNLDEILNAKGVTDPAMMLEYLNMGIRVGLKQEETDNDDGMDVCLCRIEPAEGGFVVCFAGAKRPLYYASEGELHTIKGDNNTIGGIFKQKKNDGFTTHCVKLKAGDMIFLTSDGYADQANPEGRKLGTTAMLQMFKEYAGLPVDKQKQVLSQALATHQDGAEQRDDITILGIRL